LRDVQLPRRVHEASRLGDNEEGASEIDVHRVSSSSRGNNSSIEISDITKHQISFVHCLESHQCQNRPDSSRVDRRVSVNDQTEGRSKMAKAAKKAAKKAPAKKAAKKKK
jgi:hypothetical protein